MDGGVAGRGKALSDVHIRHGCCIAFHCIYANYSPLPPLPPCLAGPSIRPIVAGRGTFQEGKTGWQMASVGTAKGSSFEDAKLKVGSLWQAAV